MKVKELLNSKDFKYRTLVTVRPDETVHTAIMKLVEHDKGSLAVCDENNNLVGIITERDIVRKCLTGGSNITLAAVGNVMTTDVVVGSPDDECSYAVSVMKQAGIRHLPILDDYKVIGLISMRDLLGIALEESKADIRHLSDYISGGFGSQG